MLTTILKTKLYIPHPPVKAVLRPRLFERLNRGKHQRLTLISAPAGFGKTTLVSEMVAGDGQPVAWLSLDEGDNDLVRFLTYLVAALRSVAAQFNLELGHAVLDALQSPQPPPTETILTALLNELDAIPDNFILVLDDYHVIDDKAVDDALTFLLEHQPPQMHLVITTRQDPQLPLPRLRVRGQLTELRAADLRFTPAEAAEFLTSVMGLDLSAAEITALEDRTEGWIAGLQLAALAVRGEQSSQGPHDVAGFVRAFAGDHRYVVDYLLAEVLERQPDDVRHFLLETAILDRLNGALCDAVTGQTGGSARLEALERGNFFVVPLDDRRHWYRYHHLFAQVLYAHLMTEQPALVPVLHRRASDWYEQNGSTAEAIHHVLAAGDFDRAADLIERATPMMRRTRQEAALLGWLKALPDELLRNRPVLGLNYAGTLLQNGQVDAVKAPLRQIEQWLNQPEDIRAQANYINQEDFDRLSGSVAMYHAGIALVQNDVGNTQKYARQVLELAQADDYFLRGGALSLLGLALWTEGELETAFRMYSEGMANLHQAGHVSDVIGGSIVLADIRLAQGRLCDAMTLYERGMELATPPGHPPLRGTADMHVGLSELYLERNETSTAAQHLVKSKELGELNGLPKHPYRLRVAMSRVQEVLGDLDSALVLLDEAERHYRADFAPNVRPLPALRARLWVVQGNLSQALGWVREKKLSVDDNLDFLREFEHITLAIVLLARAANDRRDRALPQVLGLLDRLLRSADQGERNGSVIEILVLQALAHQMKNDLPFALASLERALTLAEPEGYVRIFLDHGQPMTDLLVRTAAQGILPAYTGKLLAASNTAQGESTVAPPRAGTPTSQALAEPLSERELDILRLFKTELSGPEIADELVIALSTVRFHTKNIYSKLNVNNRRAAVQRAVELGLI